MIKSELNSKVRTTLGRAWLASVEKAANQVLKIKKRYVVSVVLVGARGIQTLNKKYRKKNKPTDVLSFSNLGKEKFITPARGEINIGEIVICPQVAKAGAKVSGHSLTREMQILYAHGLLHILGHGHGKSADAKKMFKLQEDITRKIK